MSRAQHDDSEFTNHEPCPQCGSENNLARYTDGHGFCFGCGHYEKGAGETPTAPAPIKSQKDRTMIPMHEQEFKRLPARTLSEDTCQFLSYGCATYHDRPVQVANYIVDNTVVAQKVRFKNKDFTFLGEPKKAGLYGKQKFRDGGKRLIVTEGEIDALSVSQMQGNKWPVVSVPNGAQGAAKSIAKDIEWVEKFDQVVFCFDMDEPGRDAAKECAALLTPGKALIADLPLKDPNEMLVAGRGKELIDCLWSAKVFRPDGVVDVASLVDLAAKPIEIGKAWPWPGLAPTYGRRRKELIGIGGGTGCGKSTVFKQIALWIIQNDHLPVGMIMLEEPPAHTLKTLAGMSIGKRVHVPGVEYSQAELTAAINALDSKVYFYDHFGSSTFDTIKEKIRYMVVGLGIKDIFLDHLTALAASIDTDERKAIDKIMAELSSLTQELDCTIYYISHLTTPEGKSHEEGGRVLEKQFRGSRSIGYWTHFLFALERDKQDVEGITTFRVLKDRYTGDANGVTFGLNYNRSTGLLEQCELPTKGRGDSPFPTDGDF